ncbi:hypothetical protein [Legionella jordanis]|uniref:Lipoprotein n=1 Tax=Legionella jordanis TaxID=456 RepID=A0A0W0VEU3_9GAMM|nr:hypothetical protein [Legionella jordanis]KTD18661.1 hypothetical protein Ljor_0325 [Legionella jordanis]RMX00830.1 hypothetical protein EAW55_11660 [Legionella jordanis]RMX17963.1 hypothetical protein EAS68_10035 [Legionella jordanis]VEH11537.1 Uncharacterised protein [Legionella jordanis]HAT8715118.1 hypothetical protein [Legionella jordanis]
MNKLFYVLGLALCLILGGCGKDVPPGEYDVNEVGKLKKVASGVIISKRPVKFHSKAPNGLNEKTPGSEYLDGGRGYVYVIKLNSGAIVSVAQAEELNLKVKQKVLVVYGKTTRIMPDNGTDM